MGYEIEPTNHSDIFSLGWQVPQSVCVQWMIVWVDKQTDNLDIVLRNCWKSEILLLNSIRQSFVLLLSRTRYFTHARSAAMVAGLAFLSKKGFNPANKCNQKSVWEARQQRELDEKKVCSYRHVLFVIWNWICFTIVRSLHCSIIPLDYR